jgi:hypothetical protein
MRRAKFQAEVSSDDSFLDVVANVVGVLIILVMLVGAQASRTVSAAKPKQSVAEAVPAATSVDARSVRAPPAQDPDRLREALQQAQQAASRSEQKLVTLVKQTKRVGREAQAFDRQRVELAMHRSIIEEDIELRKASLNDQKQHAFDVQRKLLESKLELDRLSKAQLSLVAASQTVTEVECIPTPMAKVVEGKSIHLRLSKGLVSIVPLEALLEEVQYHSEGTRQRLAIRGQAVETFGPLDGYRLKLTIAKQNAQGPVGGPLAGQLQQEKFGWVAEFLPVAEGLGENVEQSLLPGGKLRTHLLARRQENQTVVVWLYTDSFDEFRPLKKALWEMGFALATRPLEPGMQIKASPQGTTSAAQ